MGVAVLQVYPVPADKTVTQTVDVLTKRILNLGAQLTGTFQVDCETYYSSIGNPPRTLNVLHNSEYPASVFSVLESVNKSVTLTADNLFDLLLLKLSNFYSKKSRIESKGSRFQIGDFIVKIGTVTSGGQFKGILVEVEYSPCVVVSAAWNLIYEFLQGFLGSVVNHQAPTSLLKKKNASNEPYTPVDTIHQYLETFNNFRKIQPQQPPTSSVPSSTSGPQGSGSTPIVSRS